MRKEPMSEEIQQYKARLIDELDFLLMLAQRNDSSLIAGLEVAINTIEGVE